MERMTSRAVSAIIVAYRSQADLRDLLPSLRSVVDDIVVVDNASPDDSAAVAADLQATVIGRPRNDGFAAAVNVGVQASTGEWLLLLNPDVRLDQETVATLLAAAARHPGDVVGPRIEHPDGRIQPTRSGLPTLWTLAGEEVCVRESSRIGSWPARLWPRWQGYDDEVDAPLLSGACLLVPRATWDAVGPFDERYFLYWEEVDWQLRARQLGVRTWLAPAARVTHRRSSSTGELSPEKARMLAASTRIFVHRWFPPGRRLIALALLVAGQLIRAAAWTSPPLRGRPGAAARRHVHREAARVLVRRRGPHRGDPPARPTLWMIEPYGRGGIARYAVDVANLVGESCVAVVATSSAGPASGLRGRSEMWFPHRPGAPGGTPRAALAGLARAVGKVKPGDVAWLALGIRPAYELALACALRARGARLLGTVHNRGPHHRAQPSPLVRRAAAACHGVVVHTHAMAEWAESAGLPAVRLPFPVPDLRHCTPAGRYDRAGLTTSGGQIIVLLFGNLYLYKGVDLLLEAYAEAVREDPTLPLQLVLAGQVSGDYDPLLHAQRLGIASRVVVAAGYLEDGELLDLLAAADVVALPYRQIDHSGAGALAAAHGLPALASDLAPLRETFGETALYARPGDRRELAGALRRLPSALPALRAAATHRPTAARAAADEYTRVLARVMSGHGTDHGVPARRSF